MVLQGSIERKGQNGWIDNVDILDVKILYELMRNEKTKRVNIAKGFDITKQKARIRLEKLVDKNIASKREKCRSCGNLISECECGKFRKVIYYNYDADESERKEMKEFIDMVDGLSRKIDFS